VANSLPFTPILVEELLNFQLKGDRIGQRDVWYLARGAHDDLVLAIACAAWFAENAPTERLGMCLGAGCVCGSLIERDATIRCCRVRVVGGAGGGQVAMGYWNGCGAVTSFSPLCLSDRHETATHFPRYLQSRSITLLRLVRLGARV
jgi:hypothetical protein